MTWHWSPYLGRGPFRSQMLYPVELQAQKTFEIGTPLIQSHSLLTGFSSSYNHVTEYAPSKKPSACRKSADAAGTEMLINYLVRGNLVEDCLRFFEIRTRKTILIRSRFGREYA
jgi:hypothetical protein